MAADARTAFATAETEKPGLAARRPAAALGPRTSRSGCRRTRGDIDAGMPAGCRAPVFIDHSSTEMRDETSSELYEFRSLAEAVGNYLAHPTELTIHCHKTNPHEILNASRFSSTPTVADKGRLSSISSQDLHQGPPGQPTRLMNNGRLSRTTRHSQGTSSRPSSQAHLVEVFTDGPRDMTGQALKIPRGAANVYTKIPITNPVGARLCLPLIKEASRNRA